MNLIAPAPYASFATRSGNFTADANGNVAAVTSGQQLLDLLASGCLPIDFSPNANPRDFVDCGDFSVNPFQRNIPGLASAGVISTAITNTPTYFADRFSMVGGASSAILASLIADTSLAGYNQCLKMSRQSANANTAAIYLQHVVESMDAYRAQGQTMTLSFYAKQGANYSGGALGVQAAYGTGVNQSAAALNAGTWTGQANALSTTQALTAAWTRYQFTFSMPSTATQIGLQFSFTPSGTAGSDDSVSFQDIQLEIGASASPCERLDAQLTLEIAQRFAWVIPEPASGVLIGAGTTLGANSQNYYMGTPVQFLKAPTVTLAAGSFKVAAGAAYAAATSLTAGTTHTVNAINVTTANTAAAGVGALLGGGGGSGYIIASADF
jgi:hypothetical protein